MTLTHRLVIVAITELVFVAATRVVLHYFQWSSVEAESIRTVLRIVTALIYWWILKPLILSRSPELTSFRSPIFFLALLLFLSIPVLVGNYQLTGNVAILFAVTSLPVAIKEEFLFRGILQNLLTGRLGALKAILITNLVFTLWHVGVWSPSVWVFSQIFLAGVLLGLVYWRSGSIMAVIVLHTVYDAIFSFTPFTSSPLNENWGFIPMLSAVALVACWAFRRRSPEVIRD
jgi:membrane protease YdiL (CAAX protease family)